ncbi:asparaginyl-tRNA synthetase [Streptosporangium becharense]|uniref:Asparaginyl-tRNA synthetase n=1 Tax=Streptosporangium becharense TaxID=1816182 RepID=A0A7W9IJ36_9ACTN|nr:amino acid--tRNA ligase-related protein [Streptosporangium becharense]MBB2911300.1 asparaginyl-tRNA synthetase [Streptosporangium becharense]MBB5821642.1 asparaginyl-tRNA synthetase [Streptosporangium becharense]
MTSTTERASSFSTGDSKREGAGAKDRFLQIIGDPWYALLTEVQDLVTQNTVEIFSAAGLRNLHLPITTHSISSPMGLGSDSLPVEIELFNVRTYLADSMQFMLEYGCRLNQAGAYYLMPSFRGEDADATHLCQFFHSEAEIPGGIDDVMALVERYLRTMTANIFKKLGGRIKGGTKHITDFLESDHIPQITMDEAVELLGADDSLVRWHESGFPVLTRAGEKELMGRLGGFCWVVKPDHLSVPFYQAFADADGKKALAADLLIGMGETVGSGERHTTAEDVRLALKRHGVDPAPYEWYIKMREQFPMRTSGFGLGVERYICWLLNHADIRDSQLLERYNGVVTIP